MGRGLTKLLLRQANGRNGSWQWPLHKLRALKMRVRFRLGLPSQVPDVPEDDWEGLTNLRFALAVLRREQDIASAPAQGAVSVPETSGVFTTCWHPLDRVAREWERELAKTAELVSEDL